MSSMHLPRRRSKGGRVTGDGDQAGREALVFEPGVIPSCSETDWQLAEITCAVSMTAAAPTDRLLT